MKVQIPTSVLKAHLKVAPSKDKDAGLLIPSWVSSGEQQ